MNNPFEKLDKSMFSFQETEQLPEKLSQKPLDIFSRNVLEQNPELKNKITAVLQTLSKEHVKMPVIHITSAKIKHNNKIRSTGFIENITTNGFQARNTNVGAFVERGQATQRANAEYYILHPEEFVKSLYLFLKRYGYHGSRTNKDILGESRDSDEAIPSMLMIEGDVDLKKGTDYDDHYILTKAVSPNKIIGEVGLEQRRPYQAHTNEVIIDFLDKLESYYLQKQKAA